MRVLAVTTSAGISTMVLMPSGLSTEKRPEAMTRLVFYPWLQIWRDSFFLYVCHRLHCGLAFIHVYIRRVACFLSLSPSPSVNPFNLGQMTPRICQRITNNSQSRCSPRSRRKSHLSPTHRHPSHQLPQHLTQNSLRHVHTTLRTFSG
jgi:hypothetical protein